MPSTLSPGGSGVLAICTLCSCTARLSFSAGLYASSFTAEIHAIQCALLWALEHLSSCSFTSVILFSDSLSSLTVLSQPPPILLTSTLFDIFSLLERLSHICRIHLQWVPGHAGLEGNEAADELAAIGSSLSPTTPLPLTAATHYFKSSIFSSWRDQVRCSFYDGRIPTVNREERSLSRVARTELSRLRCNGHSLLLNSYLFRLGRVDTPICSKCGEDTTSAPLHELFQCPALFFRQRSFFGPEADQNFFSLLWGNPKKVAELLRIGGSSTPPSTGAAG